MFARGRTPLALKTSITRASSCCSIVALSRAVPERPLLKLIGRQQALMPSTSDSSFWKGDACGLQEDFGRVSLKKEFEVSQVPEFPDIQGKLQPVPCSKVREGFNGGV
jgi:hypothetical protein